MLQAFASEFRKYRNPIIVIFVFCMMATLSFLAAGNMQESSASSLANFKPGNIISDAVMGNYNSMTKEEIQQFLSKKGNCSNTNRNTYNKMTSTYPNITWHWENDRFVCLSEERFGDGVAFGTDLEAGTGQTAAEIIYEAAQEYRINPQVLIVLLEKEQGLITDSYPNSRQYRSATGYGCPDTAVCDSKYYGFKNQIRHAAALFRSVLDNGYYAYPEKKNGVYIAYNPNSSCGRSEVYIENRATAALYRYTPYQPNVAALNAGYSNGDACSAYGNRNFYLYFTDWFGSTQFLVSENMAIIPDGTYSLVSKSSQQQALEARSDKTIDNIMLWDRDAATSDRWTFKRDATTGYYTITNANTKKLLTVSNDSPKDGTSITLSAATDCTTKWKIYETADHYLTIESSCSPGMVLNYSGGSTKNGTEVYIWHVQWNNDEKWSIYAGRSIEDGVYAISSSIDSAKMIDIPGGGNFNGNNIQIWDQNYAGAQKWRVEYDAKTDYYTFTNPNTGKRIDLVAENTTIGNNINLWEPVTACSQQWKLIQNGDYYTILSACSPSRAIDLSGGNTKNTTNVQLWEVNNQKPQLWQFHSLQTLSDGSYTVVSKSNQEYALDIAGGFNSDGTNVQLYASNQVNDAQTWRIQYNQSTGDYTLYNWPGERSLDLAGGNPVTGNDIRIWSNNTTCAQRWNIVPNSDKSYSLISACSCNYALDLAGGAIYNMNDVRLWDKNTADAQKWYFIKR